MEKLKKPFKKRYLYPFILIIGVVTYGCRENPRNSYYSQKDNSKIKVFGEMDAELTDPPYVPAPVGNRPAMKLRMDMEIIEAEAEMADGVSYLYWTFGGTVPGS